MLRNFSTKIIKRPFGLLTSIDLKNCDIAKITDEKYIQKYIDDLCRLIKMEKYGSSQIIKFGEDPRLKGYSFNQLITTSNISAHFVDFTREAYIDIFSCKTYSPEIANEFSINFFGAEYSILNRLIRK